jgi:transposase InsO family protein
MAIKLIAEAVDQGVRQHLACEVVSISCRTLQHWRVTGTEDRRQTIRKTPANKLSEQERKHILAVCNSEEFCNRTPKQIVPALADKAIYLASESSFYRILRDAGQLHHRGRSANPATIKKPAAYIADGANQVWSWDITYLASTLKGVFFYLYLFMDIYSRKIVGWEVYENESSEQAAEVLRKARLTEILPAGHEVVLHSDNGSPMKGATMLATMQKLGVVPDLVK